MGILKHSHFLNPLAKSTILAYNQTRNRRILTNPTAAQSETNNQLKSLMDYKLSPIASRG